MKSREERIVGSELQPALGDSGSRTRQEGSKGLSFFEEEEEVEVLVDKGWKERERGMGGEEKKRERK